MSFIEETIVLQDTKLEEINKYFIQEDLSESERITYILKKGYPNQKENLLKNLSYLYYKSYPENQKLIFSTIVQIMENIELLDKSSQIIFCNSLYQIIETSPHKIVQNPEEIKLIFLHFFKAATTLEKAVSDIYLTNFEKIICVLQKENIKLIIDESIVEYVTKLGKYGQTLSNRKFSAFFCICLIRISEGINEQLNKRFIFLSEDTDKNLQFETVFHIRYFIKENNREFCIKNLKNIFCNNYFILNDKGLFRVLVETLLIFDNYTKFIECDIDYNSIKSNNKENDLKVNNNKINKNNLNNLELISKIKSDDFIQKFNSKIESSFITEDCFVLLNDFDNLINLFKIIVNYSYSSDITCLLFKDLIKNFLISYYINNKVDDSINVSKNLRVDYCLEIFDEILFIFKDDNEFINELLNVSMDYYFSEEKNLLIFYNKLHLIIDNLSDEFINKTFINKVFYFFDMEEINLYINSLNTNRICNGSINLNLDNELFNKMNINNKDSQYSNTNPTLNQNNNININLNNFQNTSITPTNSVNLLNNFPSNTQINKSSPINSIPQTNINSNSTNNLINSSIISNSNLILNTNQNSQNAPHFIFREEFLNHIDEVISKLITRNNSSFINLYLSKYGNIFYLLKSIKNWRIQQKFIYSLVPLPQYFMFNCSKYQNYLNILNNLYNLCKDLLSVGRNIQIESTVTELITQLVLYDKNRNEILFYMKSYFMNNKSYFRRRIYCFFIENCVKNLSFGFIKSMGIYNNIIEMLINDNPLIQVFIVKLLAKIKLFESKSYNGVENVYKKNYYIVGNNKEKHPKDIELNKICEVYLKIYNDYNEYIKQEEKEFEGIYGDSNIIMLPNYSNFCIGPENNKKMENELKIKMIEKSIEDSKNKEDIIIKRIKPKSKCAIVALNNNQNLVNSNSSIANKILKNQNICNINSLNSRININSYTTKRLFIKNNYSGNLGNISNLNHLNHLNHLSNLNKQDNLNNQNCLNNLSNININYSSNHLNINFSSKKPNKLTSSKEIKKYEELKLIKKSKKTSISYFIPQEGNIKDIFKDMNNGNSSSNVSGYFHHIESKQLPLVSRSVNLPSFKQVGYHKKYILKGGNNLNSTNNIGHNSVFYNSKDIK